MESNKSEHLLAESARDPACRLLEEEPIFSYEWPNVYDEAREMILSAILMYGLVDLRTLARRNSDNRDFLMEQLLELPISAKDVVRLLAQHRDSIEQEIGRQSTELYLGAFDAIQSTSSARELELEFTNGRISLVSFDVVVVEDELQEEELVYAICVDTSRRRIMVLFRGCSTSMDWSVAATNFLKEQDNPLYTGDDPQSNQPEKIYVHQGYSSYLFRVNPKTGKSKYESIVQHVSLLLKKHPGYQVYATGHSLGAAMATVFSFHAAATQKFDMVTCINFASPMVGNLAFETAFRHLEAQERIRCLRVTNHFDIFTQLPDRGNWLYVFACCWGFHLITYVSWMLVFFMCLSNNVYRHVGMDLHMYRSRSQFFGKEEQYTYKIKNPKGTPNSFVWRVARDWKKHLKQTIQRLLAVPFAVNFNTNHSVEEHLWRLTQLSSKLDDVYLKDLYDAQRFPDGLSPSSTRSSPNSSPFQCYTCPV